jgi:hypothetical protein
MTKQKIWTALTLAILSTYPIFFIYSQFPGQTEWHLAILPVALSWAVITACYLGFRRWMRSRDHAMVASVFTILFFYSFGHAAHWLGVKLVGLEKGNGHYFGYENAIVGFFWLIGASIFFYVIRKKSQWKIFTIVSQALPAMALTLAGMSLVGGLMEAITPASKDGSQASSSMEAASPTEVAKAKPDIYFIVLDGYGRADFLQALYNYDNSPFLDELKGLGFDVLTNSFANYPWTHLSLSSTLNATHLHEFGERVGKRHSSRGHIYDFLRDNRVSQFMKARGYAYVHLASTAGETMVNPYANILHSCHTGSFQHEIYRVLLDNSLLRIFVADVGKDLATCHLQNYDTLGKIPQLDPGSKFVFAHIISPHHPYLFDEHGNVLRSATVSNQFEYDKMLWSDRAAYVSQLKFVNRSILKAIKQILKDSPEPPIILLVSDHGPQAPYVELNPTEQWTIRLANLVAAHLPGAPDLLPDDLRMVNLFSYVLNHYFDADFEMSAPALQIQEDGLQFGFKELKPSQRALQNAPKAKKFLGKDVPFPAPPRKKSKKTSEETP